ncbi:LacI family DNA-binding transcriptional regulator [Halovulum dunhuangense]|uniref:LacI family DNA-binding transcriptional regulator n=2 Tax=Halovulum dunhuangense TaxID=1505036 RepID=A0A849L5M2_9RHOB|nr:LacI family DNA-binding transcriptional regulator [Halovulum dunhuangense]
MKDVARHAGVSQSTVSFVLSGAEEMRIGRETRARVLAAVAELGYRPKGAGRPPKQGGLQVIGVMFDEIATSPFAAISIDGIQEEAWKQDILVEVVMTGGDAAYEEAVLKKWMQDGVHGVVYGSILTRERVPPPLLARLRAILLNCHDPDGAFPAVVPAERRGGEAATRALIAAGHRRIAFISGEPWMEASEQRMEGYRRALDAAGIAFDPALVVEGNFLPSGGRDATLELMARSPRPDAIFCANDLMAVGAYEALKELGERIGETIAVMGYDDQEIAQHLSPQLSTVLLPHREMGQLCVQRLLAPGEIEMEEIRLECPLVARQSHMRRACPGA